MFTGVRDWTRLRMDTASESQSVLDRWLTKYRCKTHLIWFKTWSKACVTSSAIAGTRARICPLQMKLTMIPLSFFRMPRLG